MYKYTKRILDILLGILVAISLIPLWLPIIVLLKLSGEGEIFYRQKRIGLNRDYIYVWKFATMLKNSPNLGAGLITVRNDPRVTRVGRVLRITKLNELPQIINVLKGDMSLIGPRPLVDETFNAYPENMRDLIYRQKPGVTGMGSVVFRDEERYISESGMEPKQYYREVIAPYKGELELWYHENVSFWTDFKILCVTAIAIIFPGVGVHRVFKSLPRKSLDVSKSAG